MFTLCSVIGIVGVPISLICLIIAAIRKKPKKPPLIALTVCFVSFCIAIAISPPPEASAGSAVVEVEEANSDVEKEPTDEQVDPETQIEKPKKEEAPVEAPAEPEQSSSQEQYPKPLKSGSYDLPSGIEVTYTDHVRNDVTGNWRLSLISTSTPAVDFAMEYYDVMMSEGELHAVVNFSLNTTTCFNEMSGLLFVDTYEYVQKEEHDANQLFTGTHLGSKTYIVETGEEM